MGNQEEIVLCDTNIILEFFKGNKNVVVELERIQKQNIRISVITSMEIIYGALNKRELRQLNRVLDKLVIMYVTSEISRRARDLMLDFSLSHDLDLSDALIAATALEHGIPVYTLNLKDFRYIPGLRLYQPTV